MGQPSISWITKHATNSEKQGMEMGEPQYTLEKMEDPSKQRVLRIIQWQILKQEDGKIQSCAGGK